MNPFKRAIPLWEKNKENEMNVTIGLKGEFHWSKKMGSVSVRIATSGVYRLFVNGKFAAHGPARGFKDHFRVDEIDIPNGLMVKDHVNHIAIEVVGSNVNSFYIMDQPSFIIGEVEADGNILISTYPEHNSFRVYALDKRVQKVQRYSFQRTFTEIYELNREKELWLTEVNSPMTQVPISYGKHKSYLERGVSYPKYDKHIPEEIIHRGYWYRNEVEEYWDNRSMHKTSTFKTYPIEELEVLLSHELDEIQLIREKEDSNGLDFPASLLENQYVLYKFPYNNTGFIGIEIECYEPITLYLTFDEVLNDKKELIYNRMDSVNGMKYTLEHGRYCLESIEPYTLQYLQLMTDKPCLIKSIYIRDYVNSDTEGTLFTSSNVALSQVFEAGLRTFRQNALDIFMDCPSRERAGWLCDSFFTARVAYDLSGHTKIEDNFLENFIGPDSFKDLPIGMLPMCYPGDHPNGTYIPNWALWFILEVEEYNLRNSNEAFLQRAYPKVKGILEYLSSYENQDHLLENLQSWIFVEWSKSNDFTQDINYPTNMLYAQALQVAGELYDQKDWVEKSQGIKGVIRSQGFNGTFFVDHAIREDGQLIVQEDITETCQYYAFFFGIADQETFPELYTLIRDKLGPNREVGVLPHVHPSNAFIGNYLRLEVLSQNGEHGQVIDELQAYFHHMAMLTGTLWEFQDYHASCNHGFASHVIRCILRDGIGIRGIDHGKKEIQIADQNRVLKDFELMLSPNEHKIKLSYDSKRGWLVSGDYSIIST